jgi:hypothetical protein
MELPNIWRRPEAVVLTDAMTREHKGVAVVKMPAGRCMVV